MRSAQRKWDPDTHGSGAGIVHVIGSREAAPAHVLVLELQVYPQEGQVRGTVVPLAGYFEMRAGLIERMFLYAHELCLHHGIHYLWIHDPQQLFGPDLRPEIETRQGGSPAQNPEPPDLRQGPITPESLTWYGFQHVGYWHKRPDREQLSLSGQVDGKPAVYVFIVENEVVFVGAAHAGMKQRMDHYVHHGRTPSALRIRNAILQSLEQGRTVHVLALSFTPVIHDVNGLPIDMVAGTQAGLRRLLQPLWNRLEG